MEKLRSRLDIIADILHVIMNKGGSIKPTHLMYKANLSHGQMKLYLRDLESKGLVKQEEKGSSTVIAITDTGMVFANKLRAMREFSELFRI